MKSTSSSHLLDSESYSNLKPGSLSFRLNKFPEGLIPIELNISLVNSSIRDYFYLNQLVKELLIISNLSLNQHIKLHINKNSIILSGALEEPIRPQLFNEIIINLTSILSLPKHALLRPTLTTILISGDDSEQYFKTNLEPSNYLDIDIYDKLTIVKGTLSNQYLMQGTK